jgi:hypothetical protein
VRVAVDITIDRIVLGDVRHMVDVKDPEPDASLRQIPSHSNFNCTQTVIR